MLIPSRDFRSFDCVTLPLHYAQDDPTRGGAVAEFVAYYKQTPAASAEIFRLANRSLLRATAKAGGQDDKGGEKFFVLTFLAKWLLR
jgi:hypothetical protein